MRSSPVYQMVPRSSALLLLLGQIEAYCWPGPSKPTTVQRCYPVGPILCQILTGRLLYCRLEVNEIRLQPVRNEINETFAALNASGAEPKLIALSSAVWHSARKTGLGRHDADGFHRQLRRQDLGEAHLQWVPQAPKAKEAHDRNTEVSSLHKPEHPKRQKARTLLRKQGCWGNQPCSDSVGTRTPRIHPRPAGVLLWRRRPE
ncbi:hypothetical protein HRbin36_01057 [bacterium HR36]|nr:hypothetical protein HRbin36_01057 [bacterium HR36]